MKPNRSCGPCTACCTALGVESLGKVEGERCQHLTEEDGCGIYEDRPEECRAFECVWLRGIGDRSTRPDLLGYVLYPDVSPRGPRVVAAAETDRRRGRPLPVFAQRLLSNSVTRTGGAAVAYPGVREVWVDSEEMEESARLWCEERGLECEVVRVDRDTGKRSG